MACCCPDATTLLATAAVLGVSIYFFSKWLTAGRCHSNARLVGKTVIITGANTGIGKETARDLSRRGARVILACRSVERGMKAAKEIEPDSTGELVVRQLDLTSFKSIRKFAEEINSTEERVDILINNAGLMCDKSTTEDGIDTQFCSNHLGHFLLTHLLLDKIKASAPARIINVSSNGHLGGKMYWDDLNMEKPGSYSSIYMYCQTKLANILFTKELARRLKGTGVNTYALHPGAVITEFQSKPSEKGIPAIFIHLTNFSLKFLTFLWKNAEEGAQTTIYCAVAEVLEGQSGLYYSDCAVKTPASLALNEEAAKKLWDVSVKMAAIKEVNQDQIN